MSIWVVEMSLQAIWHAIPLFKTILHNILWFVYGYYNIHAIGPQTLKDHAYDICQLTHILLYKAVSVKFN